jgi:hypothetical protein
MVVAVIVVAASGGASVVVVFVMVVVMVDVGHRDVVFLQVLETSLCRGGSAEFFN